MKISIEKLKENINRKYEGYVWGSDDERPTILKNEPFPFDKLKTETPYIVEALLFCKDKNISVTIRHAGEYIISQFNLDEYKDSEKYALHPVEYLPHRLDGVEKVCFKQLWLSEPDPNCADMEVLKKKALIFTGFNHQPKNEKNV